MIFNQQEFDVRCEWGPQGVSMLAPISDVIIIIDVFSFCTCVEIGVGRGALIYPFQSQGESAQIFADSVGAILASHRREISDYSLSPASFLSIPNGTRIVLPSPNGSLLSTTAGPTPVLAGCLRNAFAVAAAATKFGKKIGVIPAGERWKTDGSLRPCLEDILAAGAILRHLPGALSPEARMAVSVFNGFQSSLESHLRQSSSAKELMEQGFIEDVILASMLDVSTSVPFLKDHSYFSQFKLDSPDLITP